MRAWWLFWQRYSSAVLARSVAIVYRIHLGSADASSRARRTLEAEGFAVKELAPVEARSAYAIDATIETADESDASSRLDAALSTIDHDPVIEYQVQRLDSFTA